MGTGDSDWTAFHARYLSQVSSDEGGVAAYELFNVYRDYGTRFWLREPAKAAFYWYLSESGHPLSAVQLRPAYEYCFIVDGTTAPGLSSSFPILDALPAGRPALLVTRDYVTRDPRLRDLARRGKVDIVNVDRTRISRWPADTLCRRWRELSKCYRRARVALPQIVLRRFQYERVFAELFGAARVGRLVVTNERLMLSGVGIRAARACNIRTACLQHGALVDQYLPVTVDTYLTWGERSSRWLRERGATSELCAIGAPRLDRLRSYLSAPPVAARRSGECVVAFFTQPLGVDIPAVLQERAEGELEQVLGLEGVKLIVKLHPADRAKRWETLRLRHAGRVEIADSRLDPYSIIAEAAYVGAFYSSMLVEAMLFRTPVFQLDPFDGLVPDYSRREGCFHAPGGRDLMDWIRRCEADPGTRLAALERQRHYADDYFANVGGAREAFFRFAEGGRSGL
jgi:hypothetical protein